MRSRRVLTLGLALVGALSAAGVAIAQELVEVTPASGPPGTEYEVRVACPEQPTVFEADFGRTLSTVVPTPFVEGASGSWSLRRAAGQEDVQYDATCEGQQATVRFDTENPRLRLGPIPLRGLPSDEQLTRVEGTDCPMGTQARVTIDIGDPPDSDVSSAEADIDQYGDWHVPLPVPQGSQLMVVSASCGAVTYAELVVPAIICIEGAQPTYGQCPQYGGGTNQPPARPPVPATPQRAMPRYTG